MCSFYIYITSCPSLNIAVFFLLHTTLLSSSRRPQPFFILSHPPCACLEAVRAAPEVRESEAAMVFAAKMAVLVATVARAVRTAVMGAEVAQIRAYHGGGGGGGQ